MFSNGLSSASDERNDDADATRCVCTPASEPSQKKCPIAVILCVLGSGQKGHRHNSSSAAYVLEYRMDVPLNRDDELDLPCVQLTFVFVFVSVFDL